MIEKEISSKKSNKRQKNFFFCIKYYISFLLVFSFGTMQLGVYDPVTSVIAWLQNCHFCHFCQWQKWQNCHFCICFLGQNWADGGFLVAIQKAPNEFLSFLLYNWSKSLCSLQNEKLDGHSIVNRLKSSFSQIVIVLSLLSFLSLMSMYESDRSDSSVT